MACIRINCKYYLQLDSGRKATHYLAELQKVPHSASFFEWGDFGAAGPRTKTVVTDSSHKIMRLECGFKLLELITLQVYID